MWARLGLIAGVAALAACAPEPEPGVTSYRDQTVPIASQVDVDAQRLEGSWIVRQAFQTQRLRSGADVLFVIEDGALSLRSPLIGCGPVGCEVSFFIAELIPLPQAGRWAVGQDPNTLLSGPLWVIWMDLDGRTMAIGTPDGSFGAILDRSLDGGQDRITAARDIMDWMGYRIEDMDDLYEFRGTP